MGKIVIRINRIMDILKARGYVPVSEMAQLLGVSEMTIRRDAKILEENHFAGNINGVLVYNAKGSTGVPEKEYDLSSEMQVKNEAKTAIGRFAASLIAENDIVIIDTGSTTEQIVPNISPSLHLSVLCYNVNILQQVLQNPNIEIAFSGGHYHTNTQMFESAEGINFIRSVRAHKVFVSAAGIHDQLGVTCINNYEVPTKRAVLLSAAEHILVADSSKFGTVHAAYFCDLSDIDTIVTDSGLDPEIADNIEKSGIRLYRV